jgi:hypothetical protein
MVQYYISHILRSRATRITSTFNRWTPCPSNNATSPGRRGLPHLFSWPAGPPDANPIEKLWNSTKPRIPVCPRALSRRIPRLLYPRGEGPVYCNGIWGALCFHACLSSLRCERWSRSAPRSCWPGFSFFGLYLYTFPVSLHLAIYA